MLFRSGIGTQLVIQNSGTFDFFANLKNDQQLKVKVEIGYLDIPRRSFFPSCYIDQNVNNPFYPPPGNVQGESFVRNAQLRTKKSTQLSPTVNGVIPPPIDRTGAPYCTFLEGTILPGEPHPYYNLIQGNKFAPVISGNSTLSYVQSDAEDLVQRFRANNDPSSVLLNHVGKPFIAGTTKIYPVLNDLKLPTINTYNIWKVTNLNSEYYNFQTYLGWIPKNDAPVDQLQPYAQTWSFSDTAQIQVYASNSQVKLDRLFPISKDYAHEQESKYVLYNTAFEDENRQKVKPIGLKIEDIGLKEGAVGFFIKFSSVVVSNAQVNSATANTTPRLIICWGDTISDQKQLDR